MKHFLIVALLLTVVLVACDVPVPTPTTSPPVTPTPQISPLETPESAVIEKPQEKTGGTTMDAELLAGVLAIGMSLVFSYLPGLKDVFDPLENKYKQMIMGIGLLVVAGVSFGLSCGGIVDIGLTCDKPGALGMLDVLIRALIANQAAFLVTKPDRKKVR